MDDFIISGFGEISEDLKKAIDYYPNKAEKTLEKEGRKFKKLAKENNIAYVAEGSNMSDNGDYRPGLKVRR